MLREKGQPRNPFSQQWRVDACQQYPDSSPVKRERAVPTALCCSCLGQGQLQSDSQARCAFQLLFLDLVKLLITKVDSFQFCFVIGILLPELFVTWYPLGAAVTSLLVVGEGPNYICRRQRSETVASVKVLAPARLAWAYTRIESNRTEASFTYSKRHCETYFCSEAVRSCLSLGVFSLSIEKVT